MGIRYRTKLESGIKSFEILVKIRKLNPNVRAETVHEKEGTFFDLIFENEEDYLSFKLRYGEDV
jgi:hypothetical protein